MQKIPFFPRSAVIENFNFLDFFKAFQIEENRHNMTSGYLKVKIHSFGCKICKNVNMQKMTFFDRSAVKKNFNFLDFSESLLN